MAELGDAAERFLDPRWSTVRGTFREWSPDGGGHAQVGPFVSPGFPTPPGFGRMGVGFSRVVAVGGGSPTPPRPGQGFEQWQRATLRRSDGAYRLEQVRPGVPEPDLTMINGPDGGFLVAREGDPRRVDPGPTPLPWLTDTSLLAGVYRLDLEPSEPFAGRSVVRAVGRVRPHHRDMVLGAGPMFIGLVLGGTCELTIDVASGLCLRLATFEGDRLVGLRQFTEVEIDVEVPDDAFTYALAPGQRFRTHRDDQLDMLRGRGVDVDDIDVADDVAIERAVMDLHRRDMERHGGMRPGMGHLPRTVSELVAPLGPGPADPEAARAAIQGTLDLLADDDRPRADAVERGEILDRDAEAGNGPAPHPMLGGQTVTFVLDDVAFVRADEALIEFQIRLSGGGAFPVKGRAVLTGDGWRLSYETWAGLQQMGGYRVPPVSGDGGAEGP
jgi:hypothetical protein